MTQRNVYEEVLRYLVQTDGGRELTTLANQLITLGESGDKSAAQAKALSAELQRLQDTTGKIKDFTRLKASITETSEALEKARTRMHGVAEQIRVTENPTKKLQNELKRAATEVQNLTKQQNRQQVELQKTAGALQAAGVDTAKLAQAQDHLQGQMAGVAQRGEAVASAARKTGKDTRTAAGGVKDLDKAAGASAKSLASIAARLTAVSAAVSVAMKGLSMLSGTALFAGGLRSAMELESALANVQAVSGATTEELEAMKAAAEAGGAATKFSSLEAAQGLGELARATGSAQTAIEALPATLALAQAAGLGVAQSAEIITTTLTQYGLAADQAARVSDVLAMAANATTTDVQGLGNALSYSAPQAKQLGLDLESTTAIIGALADQGFRGERAGTALRNVFSEMQDPTSAFGKALRDLGIESTDFIGVIEQLGEKGALGQEALLKLDAAARPAIMSLVNSGSKALRQLDGDLRGAAGSAEDTARIMGNSLSGAAEDIRDTFDRTRRSLIEPLLEPLRDELFALSGELEAFAQSPEFEEIKVALKDTFVEGAAAARDLFQEIDIADLANRIRTALTDAGSTITEFRENLALVVSAVQIIGTTFGVVFDAIQTFILGLAAAVTKLTSVLLHVQDAVTGPMRSMLEFFGVIDEGTGDLSEFAGGLGAVADEFAGRFLTNLDETIEGVESFSANVSKAGPAAAAGLGQVSGAAKDAADANTTLAGSADAAAAGLDREAQAAAAAGSATSKAATEAERGAERLKQAFADMGIESQENLKRAADAARSNFQLIRQAIARGEATAEDGRRAFAKYAAAMRESVAESDASTKARVEAELEVQAAIIGSTAALGSMGDVGVSANNRISNAADNTRRSLDGLSNSANTASASTGSLGSSASAAGGAMQKGRAAASGMKVALMEMSDAAVQSLLSLNRHASVQSIWAIKWNRTMGDISAQTKAVRDATAAIDEQLAAMNPLTKEIEKLRNQYSLVDEDSISGLAQKRLALEEQVKQRQEEARRARQEANEAARAALEASNAGAASSQQIGPVEDTIRVEFVEPRRQVMAELSAQEKETVLRVADAVVPMIIQRLERSRSLSNTRSARRRT